MPRPTGVEAWRAGRRVAPGSAIGGSSHSQGLPGSDSAVSAARAAEGKVGLVTAASCSATSIDGEPAGAEPVTTSGSVAWWGSPRCQRRPSGPRASSTTPSSSWLRSTMICSLSSSADRIMETVRSIASWGPCRRQVCA